MDQRERQSFKLGELLVEVETWTVTGIWSGRSTVYGVWSNRGTIAMITLYPYLSREEAIDAVQRATEKLTDHIGSLWINNEVR